jgi:nucleoside-diphosphate-sugar epimerase
VQTVAITGVATVLGQRVLAGLDQAGAGRIIGIDSRLSQLRPHGFEQLVADLRTATDAELAGALEEADTLVHLAWPQGSPRDPSPANVDRTRRLLAVASGSPVETIVHVSTATVYGAWPDNAVPLTEEAPLRPNPGFMDAVQRAEAERLFADWAAERPGSAVAVLRPVPILGPGIEGWLVRALGGAGPVRVGDNDPPRQFVHAEDVAAAVVRAGVDRLDGAFNVTPDGWVDGPTVRDLVAGRPPLPLPTRLAAPAASWAWALHLTDVPPEVLPLVVHPWVIANDRLRAAGWVPRYSNEEALVAGRPGSPWREMSPRRRQEVALAGAGLALAGATGAVVTAAVRHRRRLHSLGN